MHKLSLGPVKEDGVISNGSQAWIIAQNPPYSAGSVIKMGREVRITIQQDQPESCK